MNRLKLFLSLALAVGIVLTGCASKIPNIQSVTQIDAWDDCVVSEQYLDFYNCVSIGIKKINTLKKTASVTVTIPNLEKYLQNADTFEESSQTAELEFPVQQIDGEWQIVSVEPLTEYIRSESTRILIEMIKNSGGVTVDFDPQEVK